MRVSYPTRLPTTHNEGAVTEDGGNAGGDEGSGSLPTITQPVSTTFATVTDHFPQAHAPPQPCSDELARSLSKWAHQPSATLHIPHASTQGHCVMTLRVTRLGLARGLQRARCI